MMLFNLTLECARPSWRFRLLFSARERQLLGFAINTFMGNRHHNQFMRELEQRYPQGCGNHATQAGAVPVTQDQRWRNLMPKLDIDKSNIAILAVEYGYRACERGESLQAAMSGALRLLQPQEQLDSHQRTMKQPTQD